MERCILPDKNFKRDSNKDLTKLESGVEELKENFNKEKVC